MHTYDQPNRQASMTDKASITTYVGSSLSAFYGFLFSQEFGVIAGVSIGALGLLVNIYFKLRDDKYKQADQVRKQQLHDKMMNPDESIDTTNNQL